MLGVQLADVSTRCSSHPQGKSEARCEIDGNLWAWLLSLRAHAVRCHSGFVPPRQSSGGTNSLADTFRRKEYASVHIPLG